MYVTFDTSQAPMSASKAAAPSNRLNMSVTDDVSQAPMASLNVSSVSTQSS